jgi:hypothetical protein
MRKDAATIPLSSLDEAQIWSEIHIGTRVFGQWVAQNVHRNNSTLFAHWQLCHGNG